MDSRIATMEAEAKAFEEAFMAQEKERQNPTSEVIAPVEAVKVETPKESITEVITPEVKAELIKEQVVDNTPNPWEERYKTLQGINKQTAHENAQLKARQNELEGKVNDLVAQMSKAQQAPNVSDVLDDDTITKLGDEGMVKAVRKAAGTDRIHKLEEQNAELRAKYEGLAREVQSSSVDSNNANMAIKQVFAKTVAEIIPDYWTKLDAPGSDFDSFIRENGPEFSEINYNAILERAFNSQNLSAIKKIYDIYAEKMGIGKEKSADKSKLASKVGLSSVKTNNSTSDSVSVKPITEQEWDEKSEALRKGRISEKDFKEFEKRYDAQMSII